MAKPVKHGTDPSKYDPAHAERIAGLASKMFGPGKYIDVHVEGWDNLPDAPSMIVSNHSGGTTILDGWGLLAAWYRRFGSEVPVHALAHELLFYSPRVANFFTRAGVLRAGRDTCEKVLSEYKRHVLVMPGGDRDVWRPSRQRYKVNFAGRMGYAETAIRLGVPVVPVAHVGAHNTLWVLSDGSRFAKAVGIHKVARADIFPVHLSFPWGLTVGPWPHLPPPTRFDYMIGKPLTPPIIVPPGSKIPRQVIIDFDAQVQAEIQHMLDQLAARPRGLRTMLASRVPRSVRQRVSRRLRRAADWISESHGDWDTRSPRHAPAEPSPLRSAQSKGQ